MKIDLTPLLALRIIAADGCETFTAGPGSCLKEGSGRTIGAYYGAEQVCAGCLTWAALRNGMES